MPKFLAFVAPFDIEVVVDFASIETNRYIVATILHQLAY